MFLTTFNAKPLGFSKSQAASQAIAERCVAEDGAFWTDTGKLMVPIDGRIRFTGWEVVPLHRIETAFARIDGAAA
ncbi:hypothetical protein [Streptomyces sp. NPDC101150]|uniref:hypothetical protein n=1 Tax=Streptomyces sp. NPDC101150 TaxID=3366114 RepID=UPI00381A58F8